MPGQTLQLGLAVLGRDIADELHLVELVRAQDAARVLPRGAGLAAEARRVGYEAYRQPRAVEHLVAVQVRDRNLGRRDQEEVVAVDLVGVVLELRQLTRAGHAGAVHEHRRPHFLVAVLAGVKVDEEVHDRAHEPRALAAVDDEARAAHLRRPLQIDDPEIGGDVPVRAHALRRARLAPAPDDDVLLLATLRHVRAGHVRDLEQRPLQLALDADALGLDRRDLVAEHAAARDQVIGALLVALEPGDLLARCVALRLLLLDRLDQRAALAVERLEAVERGRERVELAAPAHPVAQRVDLLAHHPQVVHGERLTWRGRRRERRTGSRSSGRRRCGSRSP